MSEPKSETGLRVHEHSDAPSTSLRPPIVVQPVRGWSLGIHDMWRSRELLYFLTWRDVKVRYKQTFFGAAWAVFQPLLLMGVFGLFFGRLAGLPSDGVPYPLFTLAALVPWTLFANSLKGASDSIVHSERLVSKVYFPRLVIPIAAAGSFIIDFVLAFALLEIIAAGYSVYPSSRLLLAPAFAGLALLAAFAVGIWFSALNVRYRDVGYVVPFLIQAWLFASPIGYPSSIIPSRWRALYGLNPLAGAIEGFRWSVLGTQTRPGPVVAVSVGVTVVLLIGGLIYFTRTQQTFADTI
jgi:homopolymeric O-antigen transport system permease protein